MLYFRSEWSTWKGRLLALPTNIRLDWKGSPGTNTLAYYENSEITVIKSFIAFVPGLFLDDVIEVLLSELLILWWLGMSHSRIWTLGRQARPNHLQRDRWPAETGTRLPDRKRKRVSTGFWKYHGKLARFFNKLFLLLKIYLYYSSLLFFGRTIASQIFEFV
jgi:hypothetical protein